MLMGWASPQKAVACQEVVARQEDERQWHLQKSMRLSAKCIERKRIRGQRATRGSGSATRGDMTISPGGQEANIG
jgi:hypothetical protein